MTIRLLFVALQLIALAATGTAQVRTRPADDTTLVISATEVQLDAVVRDKRGRLVRDLTADDFEIVEDGQPQAIESCRLVGRDETASTSNREPSSSGTSSRRPVEPSALRAVALVFDRMDAPARAIARKTATDFLSDHARPDDWVGVFLTDLSLRVVQPFTQDKEAARGAVDAVAALAVDTYRSPDNALRNLAADSNTALAGGAPENTSAENTGRAQTAGPDPGGVERRLRLLEANVIAAFDRFQRDQEGTATTNGLLAVVDGLSQIPGRKALLFFSTGVVVPPSVAAQYQSVIDHANRAGVTIYTVDAAGLRVESQRIDVLREVYTPPSALGSVQPALRGIERLEDKIRSNPENSLGQLAAQTGGAAIRDTNDPARILPQIDEDLSTHYILAYAPRDTSFDGHFRRITVRAKRPDLVVRSREGYYAVENVGGVEIRAYEARPLALLTSKHAESAFALHARAFGFDPKDSRDRVAILASFPAGAVTYAHDSKADTYSSDFVVVAVLRDEAGEIAAKVSQRYQLGGPGAPPSTPKAGDILFYREAMVPPGHYSLELVAYDATSDAASVERSTLDVPSADSGLHMSSVVLISRAEKISSSEAAATPLATGDMLMYPNLGEPISKAAKQLAFFVDVYGTTASKLGELQIEVLSDRVVLARLSAPMPPPDANGHARFLNAIPLAGFAPGSYVLRLTVSTDGAAHSSSTAFEVTQ